MLISRNEKQQQQTQTLAKQPKYLKLMRCKCDIAVKKSVNGAVVVHVNICSLSVPFGKLAKTANELDEKDELHRINVRSSVSESEREIGVDVNGCLSVVNEILLESIFIKTFCTFAAWILSNIDKNKCFHWHCIFPFSSCLSSPLCIEHWYWFWWLFSFSLDSISA